MAASEPQQQQSAMEIFAKSLSPDFVAKQLVICLVPCNDGSGAEVRWLAVRYNNIEEARELCADKNSQFDAVEDDQPSCYPVYKLLGFNDGRYITDTKDRILGMMPYNNMIDYMIGYLDNMETFLNTIKPICVYCTVLSAKLRN